MSAEQESSEIKRELWVIKGVLDHQLDLVLLKQIVSKHESIKTVPKDYFQPEFYISKNNKK